jgi:hypothetical protein
MSRSEHPSWEGELMAYADGELPADDAARVVAHLQTCAECAHAVDEAKKLSAQMAVWQVEEAPPKLSESVAFELQMMNGLRRESRSAPAWWSRGRVWTYGLAGTFAALVLVAFALTPSLLRSRQAASDSSTSEELQLADLKELELDQSKPEGQSLEYKAESRIAPVQSSGPMVIRTIRLTLITKDFDQARAKIESTVRQAQGYIDQVTVSSNPGSAKSLAAVLRFPSDRLDAGLTELRKLGIVKEESQNTSDVTSQHADLVARLNNARNTEQRLLTLQRERTGKLTEVVEVEREISRIREEIERMEAEQKNLNTRVQYSTVHVDLSEEYRAQLELSAPSAGTRLRNAAVEGYESLTEAILGIALAALLHGPTLMLWVVLLSPLAFFAWRLRTGIASK